MLKGTILGLEEDGLPFVIDNDTIIVTPPEDIIRQLTPPSCVSKDIVNGELNDNRPIRFFGCCYDGRSFTAQGYVYAYSNTEPDPLESFSKISFTGVAIDNLSGGVAAAFDREDPESVSDRMFGIIPKKRKDIIHTYKSEIAGLPCEIMIDYVISYESRWGERQIGNCTPRFSILFSGPINIKYIPDIYLGVYDFFTFLNFRRGITFDGIVLYTQNNENIFHKTADVKIYSEYKGIKRKGRFESVTLDDLGDNLGGLFSKIASRRRDKIFDNLFIPENQKDYISINHASFLSCALSFEGEYERSEPTKEEQNDDFKQVKAISYDSIISCTSEMIGTKDTEICTTLLDGFEKKLESQIPGLLDGKSKTRQKKIIGYAQKMIGELKRVDFSLGEQFNAIQKKYSYIVGPYTKKLAERMEINLHEYSNLGQIFSDFRNQIGHGHPKPIGRIHAYVFHVGRCLTYVMILKSAGLGDEQIGKIFNKLFQ